MDDWNERLKNERRRLGMSQRAFAALAGQSNQSVLRYETGERAPDLKFLIAIQKAGADINYILTGQRQQDKTTEIDRARLTAAIEVIEEGLGDKQLPADKKAEAILLAYDLLAEPTAKRDNIIQLIRLAS